MENRIYAIISKKNISIRELARRTGISHTEIIRIADGYVTPSLVNAYKISNALAMEITQVFPNKY